MFPRHYFPGPYFPPHYFPGEADQMPWKPPSNYTRDLKFFDPDVYPETQPRWKPGFPTTPPSGGEFLHWRRVPRGDFFEQELYPDIKPRWFPGLPTTPPSGGEYLQWRRVPRGDFYDPDPYPDIRSRYFPAIPNVAPPVVTDQIPWLHRLRGEFFDESIRPDGKPLWMPGISPIHIQSGKFAPFIRRDPRTERRSGRDWEIISNAFNSLMGKGIIKQIGVEQWVICPEIIADSQAPINYIYYSTDKGKLVYKDTGGTITPLY